MHGLYYVGQWVVVAMAENEANLPNQWVPTWWVSNKITLQSYSGSGLSVYPTARAAVEAARVEAENALGALSQTQHKLVPETPPQ